MVGEHDGDTGRLHLGGRRHFRTAGDPHRHRGGLLPDVPRQTSSQEIQLTRRSVARLFIVSTRPYGMTDRRTLDGSGVFDTSINEKPIENWGWTLTV